MKKILITTSSFDLKNVPGIDAIQKAQIEIVVNPFGKKMTEDQIFELVDDSVVAMIAGTEPLTRRVLEKATNLRILIRCGIGMDNVDLDFASSKGIIVRNTPDAPSKAVAELTLAHIFSLLRRVAESDSLTKSGTWQPLMGVLLEGKTVGVIGMGRIGRAVSQKLIGLGVNILGYDPFPPSNPADTVKMVELDHLLSHADIISLHIPYTPANHHLINSEKLALIKRDAFLLNISRGGLVDETALDKALTEKKLAGAGLDCFEQEPYNGNLLKHSNVLITAHMGSYAREARAMMEAQSGQLLCQELGALRLI